MHQNSSNVLLSSILISVRVGVGAKRRLQPPPLSLLYFSFQWWIFWGKWASHIPSEPVWSSGKCWKTYIYLIRPPPPGGGGALTYNGSIYVRPLRPPAFHALPAVPKHIFFIDQPVPKVLRSWNLSFSGFIARSVLYPRKSFRSRSQAPCFGPSSALHAACSRANSLRGY